MYLLQAKINGHKDQHIAMQNQIISDLRNKFKEGGFDGWKRSVLEVMMYRKLFQLYGLSESLTLLENDVVNVFMNPID